MLHAEVQRTQVFKLAVKSTQLVTYSILFSETARSYKVKRIQHRKLELLRLVSPVVCSVAEGVNG